ncbi:XdhC family protein [Paenibacillus sp. UNC451MF]|uniref:XdhC family protein n=1 Tax=Paenibacillus sp. UNC451MF TaxID=1449063 RepID=UPI00068D50B3|nr:XdhC family protein [Paenibacillus sp. UNC451MF]
MDMHSLLAVYFRTETTGAVLATVVEVEGHAYRKAGATMLLMGDAGRRGGISPGCLEADLNERVEDILKSGLPQWVEYDMRPADDYSWGDAVGCGGKIRVLLEPVQGCLLAELVELNKRLDSGETVCFIRRLGSDGAEVVSYRMKEANEESVRDSARVFDVGGRRVLECIYAPRPRLLLFGASDDAIPVARVTAQSGFCVKVADWREGLCTSERFDQAELLIGSPKEVLQRSGLSYGDFVVVMSHSFPKDQELVRLLLSRQVRYAGIMGSKVRTERLLEGEVPPPWFRFPVGVPIGADGAEEIAVSIAAELIQVRRMGMKEFNGRESVVVENSGDIFGSGPKQTNGVLQAFDRARA